MKVIYKVRRGDEVYREVEEYSNPEATAQGISERVADPFSSRVEAIVEIFDAKGLRYDIEWSPVLMPRAA